MRKISANEIVLFDLCPAKWNFVKSGVKETKQMLARYRFSSALHHAGKVHIAEMTDIIAAFDAYWERYQNEYPLVYWPGEDWDYFAAVGHVLLNKFLKSWPEQAITPILTENRLTMENEDWKYVTQPDMVGTVGATGRYVDVDYKTTPLPICAAWVHNSDQMTGDAMVTCHEFRTEPPIEIAVCNFRIADQEVEWIWSARSQQDIDEYIRKINRTIADIESGYYPKRSQQPFNSPCSWCEFTKPCRGVAANSNIKEGLSAFAFQ